jgi:hypothetical protein
MAGNGTRPTEYTPELAQRVLDLIATSTKGLRRICKDETLPTTITIWRWRRDNAEFRDKYTEAKRFQAEIMADELLDIADDGTNDFMTDDNGNERINNEYIQRSRLRCDTRKWIACKLLPKIYGERSQTDHGVAETSFMEGILEKLNK